MTETDEVTEFFEVLMNDLLDDPDEFGFNLDERRLLKAQRMLNDLNSNYDETPFEAFTPWLFTAYRTELMRVAVLLDRAGHEDADVFRNECKKIADYIDTKARNPNKVRDYLNKRRAHSGIGEAIETAPARAL
ncbi:hypothetical protein [Haloferax gibbonsii]|uniref:Uncharacterized protein n=1 Tax=Haloferax gibbonsii TaxID=35746 RepID=A0A0K1IZ62_HALGI|nr:hypothetical protein [Haloferax gibbonsii]AKU09812.1 hypothetical protein ABY42_18505 [Haloferax gibbonsii]